MKSDAVSCRPDFMVLIYPVISMQDEITHEGSKNNLLGKNPDSKLVELMSNEKQVTSQTPPTFLVHANDDETVLPENSLLFYEALPEKQMFRRRCISISKAVTVLVCGPLPARRRSGPTYVKDGCSSWIFCLSKVVF